MSKALTPFEQKDVEFYGDELTAVWASDGRMSQAEAGLDNTEVQLGHPEHVITPAQASQISEAVKEVS